MLYYYSLSHSYRWMTEKEFKTFYAAFITIFQNSKNFPDLQAFVPELQKLYDAWDASILPPDLANKVSRDAVKNNWEAMIQLLDKLNYGVQFASDNDEKILASSGFTVIGGKREPASTAPKPTSIKKIKPTQVNGQMMLKVQSRRNTLEYYGRIEDVAGQHIMTVSSRKAEIIFNNVPTGIPLQLFVWTSGSAGSSDMSMAAIYTLFPVNSNLLPDNTEQEPDES